MVVTDPYGSVTSDLAALSVIPPVARRVVPALSLGGASGGGGQFDYHDALAPDGLWLAITNHTIAVTPQFTFDFSDPLPPQLYFDTTAFRRRTRLYRLVPVP